MEKHSVQQKRKFFYRLLVLFLFAPVFAREPSPSQIKYFTVEPDSKTFFTLQENGYTLTLPEINPSKVSMELAALPPGVQYVSSKKEEYINQNGERGTAIHLWFTFTDAGVAKLPPLIVQISGRTYYLAFKEVLIYENPASIYPVAEVEFKAGVSEKKSSDGIKRYVTYAGTEIEFTLKLKHFVQIVQYNWKLPKNSIFEETCRYETGKGAAAGREFSTEAYDVADFKWKPLVKGTYNLPEIYISATSYNGARRSVNIPYIEIIVLDNGGKASVTKKADVQDIFATAFEEKLFEETEIEVEATVDECALMAKKLSAQHSRDKKIYLILIIFSFLSLGTSIFLIVKRKIKTGVGLSVVTLILVFCCICEGILISGQYGIFAGGKINPVPEFTASGVHEGAGGIKVKIVEKAGQWYFIESVDASGWVLSTSVFEIE